MPMVVTGVFLLWLGWFGFNGGSVLSAEAGRCRTCW
jgi:Amt family ammonium transporter